MAFSLIAFYANQAISAVLAPLPLITDQLFRATGNGVIVDPAHTYLMGVHTQGPTMTRCQLDSPTLRRVLNYEVSPIELAAVAAHGETDSYLFCDQPIKLGQNEELDVEITNTAQDHEYVGLMMGDGPIKPVSVQSYRARFTGSTTVTANAWSTCTLTSDQGLQPGTYDVIGVRCKSATGVFFRLVFANQVARPGGKCIQVATVQGVVQQQGNKFGSPNFGIWGTFAFNLVPNLEILCDSADTAQSLDLDLVYHPTAA